MSAFEKKIILGQIVKYIQFLGVDEDTASDCLQEAKLAIWQAEKDAKLHSDAFFVCIGVAAIADFLGLDAAQKENQRYGGPLIRMPAYMQRRGEEPPQIDSLEAIEESNPDFEIPSGENVEQIVLNKIEREERARQIRAGFAGLSDTERAIVTEYMTEKPLSLPEIAKKLNTTPATIKVLKAQAIKKLQRYVQQGQSV